MCSAPELSPSISFHALFPNPLPLFIVFPVNSNAAECLAIGFEGIYKRAAMRPTAIRRPPAFMEAAPLATYGTVVFLAG